LSGSEVAVSTAAQNMGGEEADNAYWEKLNTLECFAGVKNLWRVSVAPASRLFLGDADDGAAVIGWGGGIRWLVDPEFDPRKELDGEDGHATLIKYDKESLLSGVDIFQPLPELLLSIHKKLKRQFDPAGIFNPGRMYRDI